MNSTILVTTSRGITLVESGVPRDVLTGYGICYGISWDENKLYVLARNRPKGMNSPIDDRTTLLVLDNSLQLIETHSLDKVKDAHQCIFVNEYLYIANTYYDSISRWSPSSFDTFRMSNHVTDYLHINSIWYEKSSNNFYICEQRKNLTSNRIVRCDENFKELESFDVGYVGIHNVFIHNNEIHFNGSSDHKFYILNNRTNTTRYFDTDGVLGLNNWYNRGLGFDGSHYYIGLSGEHSRENRHQENTAAIVVVDLNLNKVGEVIIPDVGQINGIRVLNKLTYAHNGILFKIK